MICRKIALTSLILLFTFAAGCAHASQPLPESTDSDLSSIFTAPTKTPTPSPSPSPTPVPENLEMPLLKKPARVNPLTGLDAGDADLNQRPIAVTINDIKKSLPQYGLKGADIIYEAPAEGGIPRMLAVYFDASKVKMIGSVRSARPIFINLALGHDALYLHHGGSPQAYAAISSLGVLSLDGMKGWEGSLFYRDQQRIKNLGYEHSVFTTGSRIVSALKTLRKRSVRLTVKAGYYPAMAFRYDNYTPDGKTAVTVKVKPSSSVTALYEYDREYCCYVRSEYGSGSYDANGTGRLAFRNLIVLQISNSIIEGDSKGRLQYSDVGSGKGYYFTNGKKIDIIWSKASESAPFVYKTASGGNLVINAGKTFIHIIASLSSVTY